VNKLKKFKDFLLKGLSPAMKWALLITLAVALGFAVTGLALVMRPYGILAFLLFLGAFMVIGLVAAVVITLIFAAIKKMRWQTIFVATLVVMLSITVMTLAIYLLPALILLMIAFYFSMMFLTKKYKYLRLRKKLLRAMVLGVSALGFGLFTFIIFHPGPAYSRPEAARLTLPHPENMHQPDLAVLNNPGLPGNFAFETFTYNIPKAVDASGMLANWGGVRYSQLGFDYSAMPLNAMVWMPQGDGPFPIAVMVHGNHTAGVNSYDGYAYLGEHLASRGIIALSVDQTFLNGSFVYDVMWFAGGLPPENAVRGYMLLAHLRHWYENYQNLVDWERIALIGHSRGGEAAALAAMLADLTYYPGNGMMRFDFPFSINTVVAIAPTHRQYNPAGLEVYLTGVNYLTIHGGHDKDVTSFQGADMYRRVDVSESGIKARVWMQHANHGQFNSIWINDSGGLMGLTGNRRMRMPLEEQQMAAKVLIGAFLEATLFDRAEYTALFHHFNHGAEWLPATYYIMDFADSTMTMLDDFETGFDLTQSTSGLVTYSASNLSGWTWWNMQGRNNRALRLQWRNEESPTFRMDFARDVVIAGDVIYMSLTANTYVDIGFQIRLTDAGGNTAYIHVDEFGGVPKPITTPLFTPILQYMARDYEPILQILPIPTERFGLSGEIVAMELIMDTSDTIKILLIDDLRVARP